jgi:signal transduction histidine kinase
LGEATTPTPSTLTAGERRFAGLSSRLLVLTVLFVMVAEVLVFVPSVSNFRVNWLKDKLATAQVAGIALSGIADVPRAVQDELLAATGAMTIAIRMDKARRLVAVKEMPPEIDAHYNLDTASPPELIADAFVTLFAAEPRVIRVIGATPVSIGGQTVEVALDETPLKAAMWGFARNIILLSLLISGITAALVYISLRWLIVRPMQRIGRAMRAFSENPEDPARLIAPSARADEIGDTERGLAAMQRDLAGLLAQKRHLADLGLAVSKINHDLRNILASAQLFTDRLAAIPDTTVQRLAPKLVSSLDRALGYSQAVLAYGKAREAPPARRLMLARRLIDDVAEVLGLPHSAAVTFENAVPPDLELDADPDQLFRVALNLMRNAVQALEATDSQLLVRRLTVTGERRGTVVSLSFSDTGPGVPARAREGLFKAFQGSTRPGGTGLGLAIAAELVRTHGGEIELTDQTPGATFRIHIPDRPVDLEAARRSGKRG